MEPTKVRLSIPETLDPLRVLGASDALLRRVEASFDCYVSARGGDITIMGEPDEVQRACSVFSRLIMLASAGDAPSLADVELLLEQAGRGDLPSSAAGEPILVTHRGRAVRPKTEGQRRYVEAMRRGPVTFGLGPAGTGKTYLAMALAIAALKRHEVSRIVLTRPVVEAGESLGFLPGTLEEKLDPYVRPLYDALFDMCDAATIEGFVEQGVIEIAPLAFMRGRTLNEAFVILDEAQNTTPDQMKMFLTRLGRSSRFVVTGDTSQRDLGGEGGIESARRVLGQLDGIAFVELDKADIVRHELVARIVEAYELSARKGA